MEKILSMKQSKKELQLLFAQKNVNLKIKKFYYN